MALVLLQRRDGALVQLGVVPEDHRINQFALMMK